MEEEKREGGWHVNGVCIEEKAELGEGNIGKSLWNLS